MNGQSSYPITQEFSSSNGFFGTATFTTTYALENSFKIRLEIKDITIEGFKSSIGTFEDSSLTSYGVTFPLSCSECSFNIKGSSEVYFTLLQKTQAIPFTTNKPLEFNSILTLTIPFNVPIDEAKYQKAKTDWKTNAQLNDLEIIDFNSTSLQYIINAVKKEAKIIADTQALENLVNELNNLEKKEQIQKVYANRSQFYDKAIPDSILRLVQNNKFKNSSQNQPQQIVIDNQTITSNTFEETSPSITDKNNLPSSKKELKTKLVNHIESCKNIIDDLLNQKAEAIQSEAYLKANEIKEAILKQELKCAETRENLTRKIEAYDASIQNQNKEIKKCEEQLIKLEKEKQNAVVTENYTRAGELKNEINEIRSNCSISKNENLIQDASVSIKSINIPVVDDDFNAVEQSTELEESVQNSDLTSILNVSENDSSKSENENLISLVTESNNSTSLSELTEPTETLVEDKNSSKKPKRKTKRPSKLSQVDFDFTSDIKKYKRSSLHSIMLRNPGAEQAEVIEQTFLNRPLPDKFNEHHTGPNFISVARKARKQEKTITTFLNEKQVARDLVAKWFNRNEKGEFNMELVAERGFYNASVFDVNIAKKSERGMAMLSDAGEKLIANTFVIVNDYKYTNKEEVAKKAGWVSSLVSAAATYAGAGDVALIADAVTVTSGVAGKGYVVKATAYLYRLVWNNKIANRFYNELWVDANNFDQNKKDAFDSTNLFELELIGYETDWSAVQSSAFTNKSDAQLIERATIKATDQTIARLQRKFEIFRTITPLISTYPLAAKIGLKEGLEKGDKFEVLEQFLRKDGTTGIKSVGVIKVDKNHIWDNRHAASEEETDGGLEYTQFTGSKDKYYQGMLIRQIN